MIEAIPKRKPCLLVGGLVDGYVTELTGQLPLLAPCLYLGAVTYFPTDRLSPAGEVIYEIAPEDDARLRKIFDGADPAQVAALCRSRHIPPEAAAEILLRGQGA